MFLTEKVIVITSIVIPLLIAWRILRVPTTTLTEKDSKIVAEALINPPEPNKKLKGIFKGE